MLLLVLLSVAKRLLPLLLLPGAAEDPHRTSGVLIDVQAVGQRPVTLAGYSMGARVIFYCLQALWKKVSSM